jgi:hypothetical protein
MLAIPVLLIALAGPPNQSGPVLTLTEANAWVHLDTAALKGRLSRLAWSDEATHVYLQTVEGDTAGSLKFHHYLVRPGLPVERIDAEPRWAGEYWKWKSAKVFFGDPSLTIAVDTRQEMLDSLNGTGATRAVYLEGTISGSALALAKQSGGSVTVNRLLLKGEILGEFIDEQIVPGYTFSWSPEGLRMIAFTSRSGRLVIMDADGHKQEVRGSKNALLPAWSDDGERIVWLQRTGRNKYDLMRVELTGR